MKRYYRNKKYIILFIITLLFTSSCSIAQESNYLDTKKITENSDEETIIFSYEEMIEDYDLFWSMTEENVPFVLTAANNRGKNTEVLRNNYRNRIHKDTTAQEFVDIIIKCVNEFDSVAHMKVLNSYGRKYVQSNGLLTEELNNKSELLYNTLDLYIFTYYEKRI